VRAQAVKPTQKAARKASAAQTPYFPAALPASSPILLQRKSCACGGGCPRCWEKYPLQAKLEVSQAGDTLEQEADRVAEQVLRMQQPELSDDSEARKGIGLRLSRYSSSSPAQSSLEVPPVVHDVVRSTGEPLDPTTRAFMEPRFGQDFGSVRVHADAQAAEAVQAVDARAYTVGRHIVFGTSEYAARSVDGKRLLAHELTHVVQQGATASLPASAGQAVLQRSPRPAKGRRGGAKGKSSSIDLKSARLVMGWILQIINGLVTTEPSRWPGDGLISRYSDLLSLWYELTHGKKADGSTAQLEGETFLSLYERAKAETEPILDAVIKGGGSNWHQLLLDRYYPKHWEFERRADSARRIIELEKTTTSFTLASLPVPVTFDEFFRVASAQNTQAVVLQRGSGIQVGRAVAGVTYYASKNEPRLLLWASPAGVFFLLDDQIYKQSIAGFSDDIILGAIIKAAQDVGPFVNLITSVVDIAISLTPFGFVYDLTMASKAIAEGNWRDAALELLPGPALSKATKLAKATRIGRAAFRGGAKGAKLLGKAISGTASFVGKGVGKVRGKLRRGLWLVSEGAGEVGGQKAYHFLDEAEDVWRAVPEEEAWEFVKCSKCALTNDGKGLGAGAKAEISATKKELVDENFVEDPTKATRPGRTPRTDHAKAAREKDFVKVRDDYAKRLGVPSHGQVHHGIELQVLDRYPGAYTSKELNAFENMRGIGTEQLRRQQLHQSKVREIWDRHYARMDNEIAAEGLQPGTAKYIDYVKRNLQGGRDEMDYVLGQFFTEYRTGKPRSFK